MNPRNRKITTLLWASLVLVMVGVVVGKLCQPKAPSLPKLYPAAAFVLTDEQGQRFSNIDLAGHPYVAAFIFTRCGSSCPVVSARMSQLQRQTPAAVHFVSFSVDPTFDTPAILDRYAKSYQADENRWHFLTGETSRIAEVAAGMKLTAPPPGAGDQPIVHSDHLLLVDADGMVRGVYDSSDLQSISKLASDASALAGWSILP
jgi:protein SCO1/2